MGLIAALALSRYRELEFSNDDTPDDIARFVEAMFRGFGNKKITLEEVTEAVARTGQTHNLKQILSGWEEFLGYPSKDRDLAKKLLQRLIDNFKAAKLAHPNPPASTITAIRIGSAVRGEGNEWGSIGGFLFSDRTNSVYLLSDAHVIVRNPWLEGQHDRVHIGTHEIGRVVWYSRITEEGPNYDLALAEVSPEWHKKIRTDCICKSGDSERHFSVVQFRSLLPEGMVINLIGARSPFNEATIKRSGPKVKSVPYPKWDVGKNDHVGTQTKLAGLAVAKATSQPAPAAAATTESLHVANDDEMYAAPQRSQGLALPGDSGGLWVDQGGQAVGIQILGGQGRDKAHLIPMQKVMELVQTFDPSLRLLQPADLNRK